MVLPLADAVLQCVLESFSVQYETAAPLDHTPQTRGKACSASTSSWTDVGETHVDASVTPVHYWEGKLWKWNCSLKRQACS